MDKNKKTPEGSKQKNQRRVQEKHRTVAQASRAKKVKGREIKKKKRKVAMLGDADHGPH